MGSIFRKGTAGLVRAGRWAGLTSLLLAAAGPPAAQGAQDQGNASRPSFSTKPSLHPAFAWRVHDYAIRCDRDPVSVLVRAPGPWRGRVGSGDYHSARFVARRSLAAGRGLTVTFRRRGRASSHRFHLRCLPSDFPRYRFARRRAGGPGYFMVQMNHDYATIFNRHGVPVWWYKAKGSPIDAELLPDGTVAWSPQSGQSLTGGFVVRRLNGRLVRVVSAVDHPTDIHEFLRLPNGNYLLSAQVIKRHVDASAFGGSSNARVIGFEIQEVTPGGQLVWKWDSLKHIGLDQTPPGWWDTVLEGAQPGQPLDIQHWNSAEVDGRFLLLSFRHLDAVYEINRRTGRVVWKLGGTPTSKSLEVLNDPHASYPLDGQHDARRLSDGTVSIHDNFTRSSKPPRVVRYRINPRAGTAKLVQSISDPAAKRSFCCGSARRLPSHDWLVGWGGLEFVGAYSPNGRRIFRLRFPGGFSYRAFPVPAHALTARRLRHAMNVISR